MSGTLRNKSGNDSGFKVGFYDPPIGKERCHIVSSRTAEFGDLANLKKTVTPSTDAWIDWKSFKFRSCTRVRN